MPQQPLTTKALMRALLAAGAAVLIVMSSASLSRAQDDEEDVPYDTKILRGILSGLGLKRGDEPGIEYRERSPLVVPPTRDLPPPEVTGSAPSVANWPVDPDETRRKEAAKARKKGVTNTYVVEEDGRALSPTEMTPGAATARRRPAPQSGRGSGKEGEAGDRLSVFDLGYKGDLFGWKSLFGSDKEDVARFEGEPPRTSLVQPPVGYRTPSPAQPYGLNKDRPAPRKAEDLFSRQTPVDASGKQ